LDLVIRKRPAVLLKRITAYYKILSRLRKILSQRSYVQEKIRKVNDLQIKGLMVNPNPISCMKNSQKA
jgi:hypothetical protein